MKESFGERLTRMRKAKGLTQDDIAKKITISPQAVSKWENDISTPDILVVGQLADILDVSVDELLGRENKSSESSSNMNNENVSKQKVEEEYDDEDDDDDDEDDDDDDGRTRIHISKDGIHVRDDDGSRVDISLDDGVKIVDEKGHEIKVPKSKREEEDKQFWITSGSLFGLAIITYVLLGLFVTENNIGWASGWIVFLLPVIIMTFIEAVKKKRFCHFCYPVLVTAVYCLLGFLINGWSFYWFLFITIPAYYLIFGPIDKYIHRND